MKNEQRKIFLDFVNILKTKKNIFFRSFGFSEKEKIVLEFLIFLKKIRQKWRKYFSDFWKKNKTENEVKILRKKI